MQGIDFSHSSRRAWRTFNRLTGRIAPPALRREHHTSMLVKKALLDTSHLLHACIATPQKLGRQRLRSRRPFSRQAASLANSNFNLMERWNHDWQETIKPVQLTILPGTNIPPGADLPRRERVTLNRLRTGVGRFVPTCTAGASAPQQQ